MGTRRYDFGGTKRDEWLFFHLPRPPATLLYRNMVSKRVSLTVLRAEFSTDARPESEVWGLSSYSVNQSVLDLDL